MFAQSTAPQSLVNSNTFLLNPKHQGFLSGKERRFYDFRSSNALSIVIMAITFAIVGGVAGYLGGNEVLTRSQLEQSGIETSATVTGLEKSTSTNSKGRTTTNYYLTYVYHAGANNNDNPPEYSYREKV